MRQMLRSAVVAATVAMSTTIAAGAAEASPVRVALFDMSATGGQGMMGRGPGGIGMMGRGGFGGPGMMPFGGGFGAGMMGGGMMGEGMMGAGMMSVRVDQASAKAGTVTFDVVNWSRGLVHEMLVVAVDSADAPLPYDFTKQQVLEDQVKVIGETAELKPGEAATLEVTLPAGSYLLICNVPGHYGAGMQTAFTVTD